MTPELKAGPELDALAAEKVMGWVRGIFTGESRADGPYWVDPKVPLNKDGHYHYAAIAVDYYRGDFQISHPRWSPSTDNVAAWQVVEKMREKGYWFSLTENNENSEWRSRFIASFNPYDDTQYEHKASHVSICLAALRAVGALL